MRGYVYLIGTPTFSWYKIGKTRKPVVRIKDLGILLPFKVEIFAVWVDDDYSRLERTLHEKYSEFNINGEWFCFPKRKQIEKLIFEDWHWLTRVFPAENNLDSSFANFSNMAEDKFRIPVNKMKKNGKPIYSPEFCEMRRNEDMQKRQAVLYYLAENGIPDTKENRKKARKVLSTPK